MTRLKGKMDVCVRDQPVRWFFGQKEMVSTRTNGFWVGNLVESTCVNGLLKCVGEVLT